MQPPAESAFLVDAYSDPVAVKVLGRASFSNSAGIRDFLKEMVRQGKVRMVIDFSHCTGMDSTFLGVLAGAALDLRRSNPPGSLVLTGLGPRNLELIYNLGMHRLATVDPGGAKSGLEKRLQPIEPRQQSEIESARLCLEAHESLVEADANNLGKFQDVLAFLKNRVEQS
jgi:anti-sigma B factor antagonist